MNLLILAAIFLTGVAASIKASHSTSGHCSSIGYSTACCPPDQICQATDGNCFCGSECHIFGDCCEDVYCPSNPRTCADIGITSECCNDASGMELCDVRYRDAQNNYCSCNVSCHLRNDCCSDAVALCIPRTCTDSGKNAGCCIWSSTVSCFIPGGRCYCDSYCTFYNDCCTDVPSSVNYQYCISTLQDRSRVQSDLEQDLKVATVRRYNQQGRRSRTQNSNTRYTYREPLSQRAHVQRPRVNAREYRARVRSQHGR